MKTNIILDSIPCQVIGLILAVCFLMNSYAYAIITIQVPDNIIEYGNTDINILCIVNGTSLKGAGSIQMKRSNKDIVSITDYGVFWQDKNLETRSKINATIENVRSSYLYLKILACNVTQTDEATYFCDLSAINEDFSQVLAQSEKISLNITGIDDAKTNKCGSTSLAQFVKGSRFLLLIIFIIDFALLY
nr:uncharacterized protein LOC117683010 [Crassostrea gigas]